MANINNLGENLLNQCLDKMISKKNVFSTVLRVENSDASFSWTGVRGEMEADSKYFIASVTKLYVTATVMALVDEQKLSLDDKIANHLPSHYVEGLHILKGVDYSNKITVKHLISNTSGLRDYFFYKEKGKPSAASLLFEGKDDSWEFEKTIQYVKKTTPKFAPAKKNKAVYSDTNYQLLGKIIETITDKDIGAVFKEYIFDKLELCNTYVFKDILDREPVPNYYKDKKLWLPKYMASVSIEGGIVSTAEEVMIFLKAFFAGEFFPKEKITHLKKWNFIPPPPSTLYYGIGLEKLFIPRIIFSPFKPIGEIIGFWGQTGSFAWYNPITDLYFSGTTNQSSGVGHQAVVMSMIKIIKSVI
ncbi:MAG: beta-lactamase family protein [Defluviitaleaceae bacterium]|nr:beta-lactamase family protein [Defluviitaleaceae bacterium]